MMSRKSNFGTGTSIFRKVFGKKEPKKEDSGTFTAQQENDPGHVQNASPDDFEVLSLLGKGAFGKVALVRKKDSGEQFAMKVILKQNVLDKGRVHDLFSERSVMRRIKHPFITRLYYAFQTSNKLFFVMEYMCGGDLDTFIKTVPESRFSEEVCRIYAAQVFLAVQHLHDHDVIYRDLKPENILMDSKGNCSLADFGLARDFQLDPSDTERTASFVGSPYYVAPDVLLKQGYGKSVDWWSFGVLLFRMTSGAVPFSGRNIRELFNSIMHNEPSFAAYPWVSADAQNLIMGLLKKKEGDRFTGAQIKAHPWFKDMDWDAVTAKTIRLPESHRKELSSHNNHAPAPADEITAASPHVDLSTTQQAMFDGFTYVGSGSLAGTSVNKLRDIRRGSL